MKQTALHRSHLLLGAKMVAFAGWDMPVSYAGIIAEHQAVRKSAGLFDIGHMGLVKVGGSDAFSSLQLITCNDLSRLEVFQSQYSAFCNERGGVIDDILVYRLEEDYLLVVNACNCEKDLSWLRARITPYTQIDSLEETHSALSLQGPKAEALLQPLCQTNLSALKKNRSARTVIQESAALVARTGYTGEDGFELFFEKEAAKKIWDALLGAGALPCGLGARDTLRLEAGLPLYGHEYNEEISPLEAGYKWIIKFEKGDFVGKTSLQKLAREPLPQKLFGLRFAGKNIPREGFLVFEDAEAKKEIGRVTSGTYSPTLGVPVALAYLKNHRETGGEVYVKIRGALAKAQIVPLPFYQRKEPAPC